MQTTVHTYYFDTTKPSEKTAYLALVDQLKAAGLRCFEMYPSTENGWREKIEALDGQQVTLETEHLFLNQWNTAPIAGVSDLGMRLMDWSQNIFRQSGSIKSGYWLEQTPEMRDVRRNTNECGYCGHQQPAANGAVFCPDCLDSEYLKQSDLHLLRLLAIDDGAERAPLTDAEAAHLLPLYKDAQLRGSSERGKKRIAKKRADIEETYQRKTRTAQIERDGFLWLMDHGMPVVLVDNCIYYAHVDKFSFGWHSPVDAVLVSELLDVISEFPFVYEIKCADGRKLESHHA